VPASSGRPVCGRTRQRAKPRYPQSRGRAHGPERAPSSMRSPQHKPLTAWEMCCRLSHLPSIDGRACSSWWTTRVPSQLVEPRCCCGFAPVDFAANARRASAIAAGDRFWGQVPAVPGVSRALRGRGERNSENAVVQGIRGGRPVSGDCQGPPETSMVRRGSTVRVRQRALQ
jgi:hypothetical protein